MDELKKALPARRIRVCRFCGQNTETPRFADLCDNPECKTKQNAERDAKHQASREEGLQRLTENRFDIAYHSAGLEENFRSYSWTSMLVDHDNAEAIEASIKFCRRIKENDFSTRAFCLYGETGRGKSYLAHIICNWFLRHGFKVASYNARKGPAQETENFLRLFTAADVIYIPDFFYNKHLQSVRRFFNDQINRIYSSPKRLLIVDSELSFDGIDDKAFGFGGPSLLSRISGMSNSTTYRLSGPDWRTSSSRRESATPFNQWVFTKKQEKPNA